MRGFLSWLFGGLFGSGKPAPPSPPTLPPQVPPTTDAANRLLTLHNQLRQTVGAVPLRLAGELVTAAQRHADWMARNRDMDHTETPGTAGYTGKSFADRARAAGYNMGGGGENIAAGQRSADAAVSSWVGSTGHYANMTDRRWQDAGFGVAADANGSLYWCAVFGATLHRALELAEAEVDAETAHTWVGDAGPSYRTPPAVVHRG